MEGAEQQNLKAYLLGQLPEAEEEQVELRLLTEPDFAEEFDTVVDELTDDYVAGKFAGAEREQMERYFFKAPERRNKLKFAQALNNRPLTSNSLRTGTGQLLPVARDSWVGVYRAAAAIAAVGILAGVLWILLQRDQPQTFSELALTVSSSERGEGDQPAVVRLPLKVDALKLILRMPDSPLLKTAVRYRVELESGDGEKRRLEPSERGEKSVTVVIPSEQLGKGQYFLKVLAVRADTTEQRIPGTYVFTVE